MKTAQDFSNSYSEHDFQGIEISFHDANRSAGTKNSVLLSFKLYELIIAWFWNHGFLELFLPRETICNNL